MLFYVFAQSDMNAKDFLKGSRSLLCDACSELVLSCIVECVPRNSLKLSS